MRRWDEKARSQIIKGYEHKGKAAEFRSTANKESRHDEVRRVASMIWRKKCEPGTKALLKATNLLTSWISLAPFSSLLTTFPNPCTHPDGLPQSCSMSFLFSWFPLTFFALVIKLSSPIVSHILFCDSVVKTQQTTFLLSQRFPIRSCQWREIGRLEEEGKCSVLFACSSHLCHLRNDS